MADRYTDAGVGDPAHELVGESPGALSH
ncbi:Hypothetical protein PFCIRM119_03590 [Propionibacterium freudenreichii]|uniref:Uncharacterized protein n=2 Tax=Propionibacterium freudenreichii TaxID=1744 RepID=D7GDK8_PROFC|nr:Hypothetical protein PFREUD_10960 [Propionibacterium freudenreichii subsp. shermanii CIRM-BIA1]CDP49085.1 Hypothetical protein PFCIRM129_09735 [Propionibacterium freudenreichii subsp. freudenreichii]CEG87083.1 Hypothetical protein PFCIRM118_00225 [Propionibacterium freudenreichii]CEG87789.1 Hypothetical protein PFCIRM119_03590 [Propionibacterium freudenreichii]CEG89989.1 Hypothetical protein PFCIRM121_03465 [Propionibacterium freudenreichii]